VALAPSLALAQQVQHAHPAGNHRLHSSMAWSGLFIGLMPYVLALIVLAVVLYRRRSKAGSTPGAGPA
jgi:hypothetical protein